MTIKIVAKLAGCPPFGFLRHPRVEAQPRSGPARVELHCSRAVFSSQTSYNCSHQQLYDRRPESSAGAMTYDTFSRILLRSTSLRRVEGK
jgi:hypothetical protein